MPRGSTISDFEKYFRGALLGDKKLIREAEEAQSVSIVGVQDIVRDYYAAVDMAEKKGTITILCHCRPNTCHTGVVAAYMAAELERRGKPVVFAENERVYLESVRAEYPELGKVLEESHSRSAGRTAKF